MYVYSSQHSIICASIYVDSKWFVFSLCIAPHGALFYFFFLFFFLLATTMFFFFTRSLFWHLCFSIFFSSCIFLLYIFKQNGEHVLEARYVLCKREIYVCVYMYNDGVRALVSCMYLPLDTKLLQTSLVAWKLTERNRKSGRRKQVCSSNHLLYHCDYVWVYVFNIYVYNFSVSAFACSRRSFSIWPIWNTYTDIQIL